MQLLWTAAILAWALCDGAAAIDWQSEVNVSMCNWAQFRANIIRDTVYLDGGSLWWQPGLSDGTYGEPQNDGNIEGVLYTLNLGQPFSQSTNETALFQTLSKTGTLASNNIAPNYVDGVMFANNGELLTYGGMVSETNSSSPPAADSYLGYEAYEYGPSRQSWKPGFLTKELDDNVTRYITNGAGVSAPSENMGYYFSGMRASDWGPIYYGDGSPDTLANTLISVNMTVMRGETWSNDTLPSFVPARANAELAWIPVGENGLLVAIGGVIDPESLTVVQGLNASQANASSQISPTFMETVSIYDIANQKWQLQNTTGPAPPQLTMFCSVVAPAQDGSSFNIYIYGGYNGINQSSIPSDDVYVLSVPQMVWTHAYTGQSDHGRSGHKCLRVYPDQMMILGGIYEGDPTICLKGGIVEVFNLNKLEFQDSYDPRVWNEYVVPDAVTTNIGGNGNGSATALTPSPLNSLFATKYTKSIPTYYPYALQTPNTTSTPGSQPTTSKAHSSGGGLPTWVGPVLGVVLGLIVVAAALIFFLLWRRRRTSKSTRASDAPTNASGIKGFVLRWLHGTSPQDGKGIPEDDLDRETVVSAKTHGRHISEAGSVGLHEMEGPNMPVYELGSNTQTPNFGEMRWSQPQLSPPLVSPNIDEMMYNSHDQVTGPTAESPLMRHSQRHTARSSGPSSGHRSDVSNISEIGSSDPGRPRTERQVSEISASDTNSNSVPVSPEGGAAEVFNREQTAVGVALTRDPIHTVREADELGGSVHEIGPLDDPSDVSRRQRDLTELE